MEWPSLSAAFMLGLLSSAHCVGMCGGIMGALTMAIPTAAQGRRIQLIASYNLGRICSYALMGFLVGSFAAAMAAIGGATWLRWLAGILLIAMGFYLADWWRGLKHLEAGGRYLWNFIQPLSKKIMPVTSPAKAMALGAIWGWLPCGLVYSALAYAMAQADNWSSAAVMLAFGLGTLPSVVATGLAAQRLTVLLNRRPVRLAMALLIIVFGLWTLWGGGHSHHQHHHSDVSHLPGQPSDLSLAPTRRGHSGIEHSGHPNAQMDHTDLHHNTSEASASSRISMDPHTNH